MVSAVVSVLPCAVVTNAFLCYVQALAGYPAIDWTRMVYDGSRALGFRGENPTVFRNTRCAAFWLFGAVTTAGSSSQLPGLFFCLQGHLLLQLPGRWG
jgi:hypothetical protein